MTPEPRAPVADPQTGPSSGLFRLHPDGTASAGSRILGLILVIAVAVFLAVALVVSPADTGSENEMGELVRIMYVHVPVAIACYLSFLVTAIGSVAYLWKKTAGWDLLAAASAEVGVVFTALTLATGSIWGKIAWGTWWEWDARLTSTLLLMVVYLGYLALRRAVLDPVVRAKRAAIVGLVAFANVPIVHYSVDWWRGLHQTATISRFDPTIDGLKLFALMFGMVVVQGVYAWLMMHRFRLQYAEAQLEASGLDVALAERRAEAVADRAAPAVPLVGAQKGANP
ncbi:MAG: Cytochrome c assembly protein [Acidimicrobiales bacterium]|nr:Cytochrome c assembly protein [Acidimicrobiales bacterium]